MLQTGFSISEAVLVRVLQRNRTDRMCLHTHPPPHEKICFEELAHAKMETEKSHSLLFASRGPGKAGGIVESESEA